MHTMAAALHLVGERRLGDGQGIGVGHFEDAGDTAENSGPGARFEVFLVLGARFAEMNLAVDDAGQDGQAGAVDHLSGRMGGEFADRVRPRCRCPASRPRPD